MVQSTQVHELSIAAAILDRVAAESARHEGIHVAKVGVRIGEISGVDRDALSFGFEVLVKDSDFEPLSLEIEYCPRRQRCNGCSHEFAAPDSETACPACGAVETTCIAGDELDIAYMEVEGHE